MSAADWNTPLSDHDLAILSDWFDAEERDDQTMTMLEVDGFLTAIASAPNLIPPSTWLPVVLHGAPRHRHQPLGDLLLRYANMIGALAESGELDPGLDPDSEEDEGFDAWCSGYTRAVQLDHAWAADDAAVALVAPLLVLAGELPPPPAPDAPRRFRRELPHTLAAIHRHFAPARQAAALAASTPVKRAGPKVGRNDPCPCGSGKKYKQCCVNRPG